MTSRLWILIAVLGAALALAGTAAVADTVDITRTSGYFAGSGGEFTIYNFNPTNAGDPAPFAPQPAVSGIGAGKWQTFCLEKNEYVSIPETGLSFTLDTFAVKGGNVAAVNTPVDTSDVAGVAGSYDPLSYASAWLYTEFWNGTLSAGTFNYDYTDTAGSGRGASAETLQDALWYLENEITNYASLSADSQALVTAAQNQVNGAWGDTLGNVRVLNIFKTDANGEIIYKQSQIIMIPLPPAVALGFGLLGLMAAGRRIRRRANPS